MKSIHKAAGAVAVAVVLAACGNSPTAAKDVKASGPSYDGGYGIGSGNREVPSDSVADGGSGADYPNSTGYTVGSGN